MKLSCLRRLGVLLVASCFLSGCAPAYHAYPNGRARCAYRPQPALPFEFYRCCPTPLPMSRQANAGNAEFNASRRQENSADLVSESPPHVR